MNPDHPILSVLGPYNWVGFDLDHTIIRYKIGPLTNLAYNACVNFLVSHLKYEPELFMDRNFDPDFLMRGIVLDKEHGNFLHLDSNRIVSSATHGTKRPLTPDAIHQLYGTNPVDFLAPTTYRYWCGASYFDIPCLYVFGIMIDWYDTHSDTVHQHNTVRTKKETYAQINEAIFQSLIFNYSNFSSGGFFPSIASDVGKYIEKRSRIREWLQLLRQRDHKVMLITNSGFDYTNCLLSYAFGEDWEAAWDLRIYKANKPFFFFNEGVPFLGHLQQEQAQLSLNGSVSGGNVFALSQFLASLQPDEPKVCYVGDDIMGDIWIPTLVSWSTIAVVEELERVEEFWPDCLPYEKSEVVHGNSFWQSFFSAKDGHSYWYHLIQKSALLSIPCLERAACSLNQGIRQWPSNIPNGCRTEEWHTMKATLEITQTYKREMAAKAPQPIFFNLSKSLS